MPKVPPGAKKPTDHLKSAKAEAAGKDVTFEHAGATYTIAAETFDDVELYELMGDMEDNPILMPKVVRTVLGVKQWSAFKDLHRDAATGRVPLETLAGIFEAANDAVGNSSASSGS